jgi:basic amino acid/polyamine antiporter, APA family
VQLRRRLGTTSATALVVSNMIGTGIFTTTGFLAGDLGEPSLVLAIWIVGALFATAGALCYSELGVNFPSSGGEYVYLREAYGPVWGFLSGWVSFFAGFSAPIAAAALAFAGYVSSVFPQLAVPSLSWTAQVFGLAVTVGPQQVVAGTLILALTALNCFGVDVVARIQNVLTATKLLVIVVFVAFAFAVGNGELVNFVRATERASATPLAQQFAVSLFWVMFGYSGWNAATYVAEELEDPTRVLPRALILGTTVVAVVYVALNAAFIYSMPLESMRGVVAVGTLAASRLFGGAIAGVVGVAMALAIVSTVNAMITLGPRVYYAMAKDGAFVSPAARLSRRTGVPVISIVMQGSCATAMTFSSFPQLVTYIGFALTFFNVLAVSSLFFMRNRPDWRRLRAVDVAFPLIPVSYLLVGLWLFYFGITLRPFVSAVVVATLLAGLVVYYLKTKAAAA